MAPFGNNDQVAALEEHNTKLQAMVEQLQDRITELSAKLGPGHTNCDYWKSENGRVQGQIIELINDSYENAYASETILEQLQDIIDYHPTKTIEFTATMSFSGAIQVPMNEVESFDLSAVLEDAYVDINNGDVIIDNYELYDANEC